MPGSACFTLTFQGAGREWHARKRIIFSRQHRTSVRSPEPDKLTPDNCKKESPMNTIMLRSRVVRCFAVVLFSAAWLMANGQSTTATLSGVVHDPTGAVLPQVKITIKNSARGTTRTAVTD